MKNLFKRIAIAWVIASACTTADAQDAGRVITKISGDVYRFHNQAYYSLVIVTDEGVVVVDPINPAAAYWLKSNLGSITDKSITHLIYSHSHPDHAAGGGQLGASTVVAHANAPNEIYGVKPTIRFDETKTLNVGGKTLELTWLGEGHAKDLIAVIVRPENVAFIVDVVSPKRLPWRDFPYTDIDGMIAQIKRLQTLDFKILMPGHGVIGTKTDVDGALKYIQTLRAEVLAGLLAGKSVEELQTTITMNEYEDWSGYQHRRLNIQGMAKYLINTDKVN